MTSASFHPQSGPLRPAQKDSVLSFKKTYPGPALVKLLLGQTGALQKFVDISVSKITLLLQRVCHLRIVIIR